MKVVEQKNVQSPKQVGLMYAHTSLGWPLRLKTQIPIWLIIDTPNHKGV